MALSKSCNTFYKTILADVVTQLSAHFRFDYEEAMDLFKLKKEKVYSFPSHNMNNYFTRTNFTNQILPIFATKLQHTIAFFKSEEGDLSSKTISEIASQWLEVAFKNGIEAECPKKDSEPDCKIFNKETQKMDPWELKCTSGENWRGGEYSKRPGYYVLMAYNITGENEIECFAGRLYLVESDWNKSKKNKEGKKNYYATTFGKKDLMAKIEAGEAEILFGSIERYRNNKCIRMTKQKIS